MDRDCHSSKDWILQNSSESRRSNLDPVRQNFRTAIVRKWAIRGGSRDKRGQVDKDRFGGY